jgi:hypothetical protein
MAVSYCFARAYELRRRFVAVYKGGSTDEKPERYFSQAACKDVSA